MKHYSSVIIGHITMDRNVDHLDNEIRSPGGSVIFSSASEQALGHNVLAVTKVAKADQERLSAFTIPEENLLCIDCESSSNLYNHYFTPDKERRKCVCTSVGTPFVAEDIPEDPEAESAPLQENSANSLNLGNSEKELIIRALAECDNNRAAAARALGISRRTLYRKLDELGI